jgi:hypothetical protein
MVHVHLKVGDLHIHRGDADKIRLRCTIKSHHEHHVKESSVDFDVRGSEATLDFHAPTSNTDFDVELEVPANTNVDVHMKVGDLTVENVEGDKDLELGVGDIRVTREPATYHLVRASTGIGDVNGDGNGDTSGWLGKTLKYMGEGKYELRAHVRVRRHHARGQVSAGGNRFPRARSTETSLFDEFSPKNPKSKSPPHQYRVGWGNPGGILALSSHGFSLPVAFEHPLQRECILRRESGLIVIEIHKDSG